MYLNKVFLIGRMVSDPQLRNTPGGQSVASFSIATNRTWMNKAGEKKEEAQFHNIVAWGRQAEIATQYLKKGGLVMVEGRLQTRGWKDSQGQNRKTTEIICERLQLGPRSFGAGAGSAQKAQDAPPIDEVKEELPEINIEEGDIQTDAIPF